MPAPLSPTMNAIELRHRVLVTILQVQRLRIIVITPASPRLQGSPLAHAFLFISPFLKDWTNHNVHWGLAVQAHPNQPETYIQADVSTHAEGSEERSQTDFSFPVYVLRSNAEGTEWDFARHATRSIARLQGMVAELERLSLI